MINHHHLGTLPTSLAPALSNLLTEATAFRLPSFQKVSTILSPISTPLSSLSTTATAVGPAPLIVHPKAPASRAAFLTPSIPGIKGALLGSTILSLDNAFPSPTKSPFNTEATKAPA
ncbi:hypothetical protein NC653_023955 [Populus alba x Populus x berolinensis]|uniref:Uncharacterized protein n=1 Tax=Populus alba x Populus x berolinensis TaxID=444605 RepID=A0AAD6MJ78_9ROSI|nr:hypothetical protein NC653_023955 [Populus alba x Populus x berolinensis]